LIEIGWLDASESTGRLERARCETPVRSVGFYLGVKGKRTKHIVKKFVHVSMAKLRGRDGWAYAERGK